MDAANKFSRPRNRANAAESAAVAPVVTAVKQPLPAVDAQSVRKRAEADESFRESDMNKERCDGTKVLGKRKILAELNDGDRHGNCEAKYEAYEKAWAKWTVLRSLGIKTETPPRLLDPDFVETRESDSEDDSDKEEEEMPCEMDKEDLKENRQWEVLRDEFWLLPKAFRAAPAPPTLPTRPKFEPNFNYNFKW